MGTVEVNAVPPCRVTGRRGAPLGWSDGGAPHSEKTDVMELSFNRRRLWKGPESRGDLWRQGGASATLCQEGCPQVEQGAWEDDDGGGGVENPRGPETRGGYHPSLKILGSH